MKGIKLSTNDCKKLEASVQIKIRKKNDPMCYMFFHKHKCPENNKLEGVDLTGFNYIEISLEDDS